VPLKRRAYEERDLEELHRVHAAQKSPYAFPGLQNPLFVTKIVLTDGENANEKIRGAALLRLTAEAFLLLDPSIRMGEVYWRTQ